MSDNNSHQGWYDRLETKSKLGELSISEDMLLTLHHINNNLSKLVPNAMLMREGVEHLEGMMGAVDDMLGNSVPGYPTSEKVRQALDAQRDQARQAALSEGETP